MPVQATNAGRDLRKSDAGSDFVATLLWTMAARGIESSRGIGVAEVVVERRKVCIVDAIHSRGNRPTPVVCSAREGSTVAAAHSPFRTMALFLHLRRRLGTLRENPQTLSALHPFLRTPLTTAHFLDFSAPTIDPFNLWPFLFFVGPLGLPSPI
ncbi:hypothetical protein BKA81DRAFT_359781 [Phyllosticta paracitricarpa]